MTSFYWFCIGAVVMWPIAYLHGVDDERKWWKR